MYTVDLGTEARWGSDHVVSRFPTPKHRPILPHHFSLYFLRVPASTPGQWGNQWENWWVQTTTSDMMHTPESNLRATWEHMAFLSSLSLRDTDRANSGGLGWPIIEGGSLMCQWGWAVQLRWPLRCGAIHSSRKVEQLQERRRVIRGRSYLWGSLTFNMCLFVYLAKEPADRKLACEIV